MKGNHGKDILHNKWFAIFELITSILVIIVAILMIYFRTPSYDKIPDTYANLTEHIRIRITEKEKAKVFASIALAEGNANLSRLFVAYSEMQEMNALKEYELLNSISDRNLPPAELFNADNTVENINAIILSERNKVDILYSEFIDEADAERFNKAKKIFETARRVSKENITVFEQALSKQYDMDTIYGCMSCGNLAIGDIPDKCNICNKKEYKEF